MPQPQGGTLASLGGVMDQSQWDKRVDGSQKGMGFLGPLARPDGGVSTEISMGTEDVNGHETEIPLIVPTLTADEVNYLLSAPPGDWKNPILQRIIPKAVDFARQRQAQGKPFFATYEEQNTRLLPEIPRYQTPDRPVASHYTLADLGRLLRH